MNGRQITAGACGLIIAMVLGSLSPAARARDGHDHSHGAVNAAHDAPDTPSNGDAVASPDRTPAPELSARWRVRFEPSGKRAHAQRQQAAHEQVWQLHRAGERIVWSKGTGLDEVWVRDRSGISLKRVMHEQRHVIEYTAGELRTLGVEKDWHDLGTLFPERDLATLKPVGTRKPTRPRAPAGEHAHDGLQRLRGAAGGAQVDLLWDAHARLPVTLVQTTAQGRMRFERIAVEPGAQAAGAWSGAARAADYNRIDAADFGDMEHEPVVRLAMAFDERLGWRRAHRH